MANICAACGGPIAVKMGRRPTYCSNACRQRAYRARRAAAAPPHLAGEARWVRADGKRPLTVTGAAASSTNPATWATLEQVRAATAGDGYGVMCGGGLACVDLDDAIDAGGRLRQWARRILDACPGAHVEYSVSGRGLHVFGAAAEAPGCRRGGVEVYSRHRFIRVTGRVFRPGRWDAPLDLAGVIALAAT